jgi:hypothetical protein
MALLAALGYPGWGRFDENGYRLWTRPQPLGARRNSSSADRIRCVSVCGMSGFWTIGTLR